MDQVLFFWAANDLSTYFQWISQYENKRKIKRTDIKCQCVLWYRRQIYFLFFNQRCKSEISSRRFRSFLRLTFRRP